MVIFHCYVSLPEGTYGRLIFEADGLGATLAPKPPRKKKALLYLLGSLEI